MFGPGEAKIEIENCKETLQDIYVIENLKEPLLGRSDIDSLDLVPKVEIIKFDDSSSRIENEAKSSYPSLFIKVLESWKENLASN